MEITNYTLIYLNLLLAECFSRYICHVAVGGDTEQLVH